MPGNSDFKTVLLAIMAVSLLYMPAYLVVSSVRHHEYISAKQDLKEELVANFEQSNKEENTAISWQSAEIGRSISATNRNFSKLSSEAEEEIEPLAFRQWNSDYRITLTALLSRFFGWEQFFCYVLSALALIIIWQNRRAIKMACDQHGPGAFSEDAIEDNLTMVQYAIWAIPTIGFIGTVRGMSQALAIADSPEKISEVTSYLGVAFDTTLISLLLITVLMLVQSRFDRYVFRMGSTE